MEVIQNGSIPTCGKLPERALERIDIRRVAVQGKIIPGDMDPTVRPDCQLEAARCQPGSPLSRIGNPNIRNGECAIRRFTVIIDLRVIHPMPGKCGVSVIMPNDMDGVLPESTARQGCLPPPIAALSTRIGADTFPLGLTMQYQTWF